MRVFITKKLWLIKPSVTILWHMFTVISKHSDSIFKVEESVLI